jgi:uncharacterized heparinase superfamily protein
MVKLPMYQYLRAIQYLKPIQIYGQIRNRIISKTFSPDYWKKRAEIIQLGDCVWNPIGDFLPPGPQHNTAQSIKNGNLTFLNIEQNLGYPFNWSTKMPSKLWEYNLHYFEYIFALNYDDAKFLVQNWIENYSLARYACGWEPYPTSLRIMNWVVFFFGQHRNKTVVDIEFETILKKSLALHAIWLVYRLEYHLLGNHYLENTAALSLLGSCFNNKNTTYWFQIGTNILRRELAEQILNDGMHFERSPMYHLRIVYLLKLLHDTGNHNLREIVTPYLNKTIEALQKLCHPDGQIALFNDAALGIYNQPEHFFQNKNFNKTEYFDKIENFNETERFDETENFQLSNAGYFGAKTNKGHYILCDAGKIGPDYLPGHAHGDIFSFELSFFGKRMIVDSGVYDYVNSPNRKYCRSTAAHNTIEIDKHDQCEFFDAFKVGRRISPCHVIFETLQNGFRLSGELFYNRKTIHRRLFEWNHDGILKITDHVDSSQLITIISRFHLHPDCKIIEQKNNEIIAEHDSIRWKLICCNYPITLDHFDYSPEFGLKIPGIVIESVIQNHSLELQTIIEIIK